MEQAISYRDRDGFVTVQQSSVRRYVAFSYAEAYDRLMHSGLYQRLVEEGLLIPHKEISSDPGLEKRFYKILQPEWIPFISLPYEWTAGQWKEAAITLLRINTISISYGMILKDATPFNLCFYKGNCIFFDTLSFELYRDGEPWIAYRQFCEMVLGPLSMIFFNDIAWGRMLQSHINGWPLSFISANLPKRTWLHPSLLLHIHWHARMGGSVNKPVTGSSLSSEKLLLLWQMMEKTIRGWKYRHKPPVWIGYYDSGILSEEYLSSKTEIVTRWLDMHPLEKIIDLGCNDGLFSLLGSLYANQVLAIEADHDCIEKLRADIEQKKVNNIETILANITMPTPALGWENQERFSLLERLEGDMLLMLAVLHHICIASNIPLSFAARLAAKLTTKYAIVEFVPKTDPKVISMLANRKDIFSDYTEENFLNSFGRYFLLKETITCNSSERKLFLWERR